MAINIKLNEVGIISLVVGAIGTVYGIVQAKKTNDVGKKLSKAIDELDKSTVVNVQQDIITAATNRAVERQVASAVKKAIDNVSQQIRDDCDSMIRKDVDRVYSDLKESVQERVSEEIASIDYDEMRADIRRKAERKVFDEFLNAGSIGRVFGNVMRGSNNAIQNMEDVSGILSQFWSDSDKIKALNTIFGKGM